MVDRFMCGVYASLPRRRGVRLGDTITHERMFCTAPSSSLNTQQLYQGSEYGVR
jgi:hypothetical protein